MDVQHMHHDIGPLLEELQGILQGEIEAYEHLLERQQAEKQLLVARVLEPFLSHLHAKEHLLHTMSQLEQKRQQVLHRLAPLLGFPTPEMTLQQLSMCVPEPFAKTLLQYRSRLQGIIQPLQRCNRDNARLLQDSLTLINETRLFLAALAPDTPTYQRSGTFLAPTQGRLLSGTV
jgi:flagellar biosynthesis/type III secretory pathway chaperone